MQHHRGEVLGGDAAALAHAGDLPGDTDPDQVVFELLGVLMSLNHALQLHQDDRAPARARRAVAMRLGLAGF
ncbi:hypothetical protein ABZ297_04840 [Nonomuraea sp. NPDC005983]|uniref:TetR family transcriptional regulator C-terminal domain-containing protein n=1 Tax=Nonomuraea sp. NPDC005983 TaxID=3155595 RepID=UPI0033B08846